MTRKLKMSSSSSVHAGDVARVARGDSRVADVSRTGSADAVSPTSERIIRETSVKRQRAMKVLANR